MFSLPNRRFHPWFLFNLGGVGREAEGRVCSAGFRHGDPRICAHRRPGERGAAGPFAEAAISLGRLHLVASFTHLRFIFVGFSVRWGPRSNVSGFQRLSQ